MTPTILICTFLHLPAPSCTLIYLPLLTVGEKCPILAMRAHYKEVLFICGGWRFVFQVAATTRGLPWDRTRLACLLRRRTNRQTRPWDRTRRARFLSVEQFQGSEKGSQDPQDLLSCPIFTS